MMMTSPSLLCHTSLAFACACSLIGPHRGHASAGCAATMRSCWIGLAPHNPCRLIALLRYRLLPGCLPNALHMHIVSQIHHRELCHSQSITDTTGRKLTASASLLRRCTCGKRSKGKCGVQSVKAGEQAGIIERLKLQLHSRQAEVCTMTAAQHAKLSPPRLS